MAMSIKILGWKSSNLRCPDHDLSFNQDADHPYPITLVQMPNGTGKTTALDLLRVGLSGEADTWSSERILDYAKHGETHGEFQIKLLYNQKRLTITMRFDFSEGRVRYVTTLGQSGLKDGFHLPPSLQNYLRKDFVRFFVFDGEFAHRLLDRESPNAQSVIEELFQLHHFTELSRKANQYWERQVSKASATEEKGLTQRTRRVEYLRGRIEQLKQEQEEYRVKRDRVRSSLARRRKKIQETLGSRDEIGKRLQEAEAGLAAATTAKDEATQALFAEFRNPHSLTRLFAQEILDFKSSLDRVKLPENTAREFFEELAQEKKCVCGTALDEKRRAIIRARAPQYLGSEDVSLLNSLKSDVAYLIGTDPAIHEKRLCGLMSDLQVFVHSENSARVGRDAIEKEGVGEDPSLERAQNETVELEKQLQELDERIEKYDDRDDSLVDKNTFGITCLERRLSDAEKKLAEITETLTLRQKRDILIKIFNMSQGIARKSISQQLTDESNENFAKLMPHNEVRIKEINRFLVLDKKSGASVGETLAVAYSFISTLLSRGEIELPFVIDSPANPIDLQVRPKVAALVPHLAHQFIAFVISSERQGFVQSLENAAKDSVQYITLFRKGQTNVERAAKKAADCHETRDGIVVYDKAFFHQFHGDEE